MTEEWVNKLFFGDNLYILREHVPDESVDLIYLDPPFKSNATYNVLFKEKSGEQSTAQITAFEDTWHWGIESESAYSEVVTAGPKSLSDLMQSFRAFLGQNDMMAYLTMMAIRMLELHRVLKPTGSIFLHCDTTASHYLRILMDAVFRVENFRNEIIWRRTGSNKGFKRFGPIHQTILFYAKSKDSFFVNPTGPYTKDYIKEYFVEEDERGRYRPVLLTGPGIRTGDSGKPWRGYNPTDSGRHWQPASYLYRKYKDMTGDDLANYSLLERLDKLDEIGMIHFGPRAQVPQYKYYLLDALGVPYQDIWAYQPGTQGSVYEQSDIGIDQDVKWLTTKDKERLGYQTQKPEGVLERIIKACSKKGDIVLDPFCGCGTTVAVAERFHRRWIGIDLTHLAISLMVSRLKDTFGPELSPYKIIGVPKDLSGAKALAEENRYQFEWWALHLVEARPAQDKKKGADTGIDGYIYFFDDKSGKAKKIIVQVKSGKVQVSQIRDLKGVIDREKAVIGAFITLNPPTKPMNTEAVSAGFYEPDLLPGNKYPRIQILTIEELLDGKKLEYPQLQKGTFQKAQRKAKEKEDKGQTSFIDK